MVSDEEVTQVSGIYDQLRGRERERGINVLLSYCEGGERKELTRQSKLKYSEQGFKIPACFLKLESSECSLYYIFNYYFSYLLYSSFFILFSLSIGQTQSSFSIQKKKKNKQILPTSPGTRDH